MLVYIGCRNCPAVLNVMTSLSSSGYIHPCLTQQWMWVLVEIYHTVFIYVRSLSSLFSYSTCVRRSTRCPWSWRSKRRNWKRWPAQFTSWSRYCVLSSLRADNSDKQHQKNLFSLSCKLGVAAYSPLDVRCYVQSKRVYWVLELWWCTHAKILEKLHRNRCIHYWLLDQFDVQTNPYSEKFLMV